MCVIQSAISNLRKTLRHVPNKIKPHLLCFKMSCVNPSNWFDIGDNALFDPMVILVHGGKSQVNHFVGEHPVRGEHGRGAVAADAYGFSPSDVARLPTVRECSASQGV